MNYILIQMVTIKRFLCVAWLVLWSVNSHAFFWDQKIKIICYADNTVSFVFTYELKNQEIYSETIIPKNSKSGKDELISLSKLEECTIKDSKNWMCGGKSTFAFNKIYRSESHAFYEGRYTYKPSSDGDLLCDKRIQSK